MIRVGIAGIGFMGMIHYLAYQKVRGARVTAICTRDKKKLAGDWRSIQGNFGPAGTKVNLGNMARYRQLDEMIADNGVDVIDVCLPPALHAPATLAALAAGKHVFCEKPIALTTADAQKMVRAAARRNRQLLIGHVLPFFPEYAYARKLASSGKYGRLLGGHFKRVISDPLWIKDFYDPRKVGGPVIDLHIHDAHFIRLLFGMPKAVFSSGRTRGGVVEYLDTQFLFDDPRLVVSATGGVIDQQGRPFTHGFELHFERATLWFDFAVIGGEPVTAVPLTLLTARGKVTHPDLGSGDPINAFVSESSEVCRSIRSGRASTLLDGSLARDALLLCQRQSESVKRGRKVAI